MAGDEYHLATNQNIYATFKSLVPARRKWLAICDNKTGNDSSRLLTSPYHESRNLPVNMMISWHPAMSSTWETLIHARTHGDRNHSHGNDLVHLSAVDP